MLHLYSRTHNDIKAVWSTAWNRLSNVIRRLEIPSDICILLKSGVWRFLGRTVPLPETDRHRDEKLKHLVMVKNEIRWGNFLKGRIAFECGYLMLHEYKTNHRHDKSLHHQITPLTHPFICCRNTYRMFVLNEF